MCRRIRWCATGVGAGWGLPPPGRWRHPEGFHLPASLAMRLRSSCSPGPPSGLPRRVSWAFLWVRSGTHGACGQRRYVRTMAPLSAVSHGQGPVSQPGRSASVASSYPLARAGRHRKLSPGARPTSSGRAPFLSRRRHVEGFISGCVHSQLDEAQDEALLEVEVGRVATRDEGVPARRATVST